MAATALMTVEQFAQMEISETQDFELVDGKLVPVPSATWYHNKIRLLIAVLLWNYFQRNPIGDLSVETDFRLAPDTDRRPDVAVVLAENLTLVDRHKSPVPFAPDIAIEVLSPSESAMDVRRKVRDYLRAGTREVWLVDHSNAEVVVHTDAGVRILAATESLESELLPGFSTQVASLLP